KRIRERAPLFVEVDDALANEAGERGQQLAIVRVEAAVLRRDDDLADDDALRDAVDEHLFLRVLDAELVEEPRADAREIFASEKAKRRARVLLLREGVDLQLGAFEHLHVERLRRV